MPDSLTSLLIQIPLVGVFMWFVQQTQARQAAEEEKRDSQWRDFLREQREANNLALGRLAEEIKSIAMEVSNMRAVLVDHEVKTAQRLGPERGRRAVKNE